MLRPDGFSFPLNLSPRLPLSPSLFHRHHPCHDRSLGKLNPEGIVDIHVFSASEDAIAIVPYNGVATFENGFWIEGLQSLMEMLTLLLGSLQAVLNSLCQALPEPIETLCFLLKGLVEAELVEASA